ncbi:glycosyltransferase family 4 protein [Deinococcus sp. Arct2-2]|uniref:glycosyltransferase family 4 protein n=1 Tax=Deinococcus sp. Arct2-2 TaxID=2568653 RepID=UPI001F0F7A84|nr:glycosyltransferase family 4 protein [Deinococcus sp. Arct2-2]
MSVAALPALTVAFLTDAPRVAGSEVWLLEVLPRLGALGIAPAVFLPQHAALNELASRFGAAGVPTTRYSDPAHLPDLTRPSALRVVQAWDAGTYTRVLPALAQPKVVMIHDQLDYHYPLGLRPWYRTVYRHTKSRGLRGADGLLTVSAWGQAFLSEQLGLPVAGYVPNGVDTQRYRPATPDERAILRAEFGFTRFTVLVPGRFAPEKNQLAALRAARHAPGLDFVFVGDMDSPLGSVVTRLQRTLRLKNVRFLGRRWEMPELYRASDALLQPTLAENQSLVTLEAMASGLPVVTTDIPAQAELIEQGVHGLLISPQPPLLALALRRLADHPDRAQQLGAAARARVLERHTLEATAQRLAEVLRGAISAETNLH